jgi:hypothetical protein
VRRVIWPTTGDQAPVQFSCGEKSMDLSCSHRALKIHGHVLVGGCSPKGVYLLHRLQTRGIYPRIAAGPHEMCLPRSTISPYDDCNVSAGAIRRIKGVSVEILLYLCFNCFQIAVEIWRVLRSGPPSDVIIPVCGCRPW